MADEKQKSALFRRQEQLQRWADSETNKEKPFKVSNPSKVQFQDGCVFLAACASGDRNEVRELLEKGADINTANVDGLTALHQACIDDNIDMVEFLAENGADLDVCDNEGWTPLHATASCGFTNIAKFLIDAGANVAAVNNDGDLSIDLAEGDDMEQLLEDVMEEQGIDADAARREEEDMMLADANQWMNSQTVEERAHSKTGATALHVAAAKGYLRVMHILLQAGVDIDAKDADGWTPLHAAAHWGQEEACKILVENMCNMEVKNNAGQSAFDVADTDLLKLLEELKKKQATLKADKKDLNREIIQNKMPPPLKRRTSVTRMSMDQKQHMVMQNVEEERRQLEAVRKQEEKRSSSSSEGSSEEDAEDEDRDEEEEESSDSETEKQNEINKQATAKAQEISNGIQPEPTPKTAEIPKIVETPEIKAKPEEQIRDIQTKDERMEEKEKANKEEKIDQEGKLEREKVQEKEKMAADEKVKENEAIAAEEKREANDVVSDQASDQRPPVVPPHHELLSRQSSAPARLGPLRQAPSFTPRPLTKMDSDSGPASWRSGLRKTGSSSAVPESSKKDSESDKLTSVQRSASSPWLAPDKKDDDTRLSRRQYTGSGSVLDSIETRQRGDRTTYPYTTRSYTTNYLNSLQNSTSPGSHQSAYVPYSRRRQLENDRREREREQQLQSGGNISNTGVPIVSPASVAGTTTTGYRRSYELPKRDEESETQRKARAKRTRETRRSTQGVTLEDLEEALEKQREYQKEKKQQEEKEKETKNSEDTSSNRAERVERRRPIEDRKDTDDRSSIRRTRESRDLSTSTTATTTPSTTTTSSLDQGYVSRSLRNSLNDSLPTTSNSTLAPPASPSLARSSSYTRKYYNRNEDEQKVESKPPEVPKTPETKEKEREDPRDRSSAIRARKKRNERRSTGIVYFNEEAEKNREKKEEEDKKTEEPAPETDDTRTGSRYSTGSRYGTGSDTTGDRYSTSRADRPSSYSSYSRTQSSTSLDSAKEYKKLYEEEKLENERLRKDITRLQQDLTDAKLDIEKLRQRNETRVVDSSGDKRERRALERKLSELEEELKLMENLKADNQRLKEENGALIRVISKLSK